MTEIPARPRVVAIVKCPRCLREFVGRKVSRSADPGLARRNWYVPAHKAGNEDLVEVRCPGSTVRTTRLRWEER